MDEQCTADGESISIRVHGVAAGEESLLSGTPDVYLSEDLLFNDVRIDLGLGLWNLTAFTLFNPKDLQRSPELVHEGL